MAILASHPKHWQALFLVCAKKIMLKLHSNVIMPKHLRSIGNVKLITLKQFSGFQRTPKDSECRSVVIIVFSGDADELHRTRWSARKTSVVTDASVVACFTSMSIAPNASPRLWETRTLKRTIRRDRVKVRGSALSPPIQYRMKVNAVGNANSSGKSPTVFARK
nr:hypothetical protein Iba_chr15cCG2450 [Ipomoea batatas]